MCVFGGCGERKSVFPSPDQADAIRFRVSSERHVITIPTNISLWEVGYFWKWGAFENRNLFF